MFIFLNEEQQEVMCGLLAEKLENDWAYYEPLRPIYSELAERLGQ